MLRKAIEANVEDVLPGTPFAACWCLCCCVVNFVVIILFFPCTMTQLGQFKMGLVRNKITGFVDLENTYEPGRYWIGFWQEFIEFPSTLQTIEFSEEKPEAGVQHLTVLKSRDKDGKQILLDVSIQYRLSHKTIGNLYKEMLIEYENIFIAELRDQLAKAANLFEIQDAWQNYDSVVELMRVRCEAVLKKRFAECWGLQLWGVTLTKRFEAKLIQTQVRKQAQKTGLAKKTQAEVRAKTQVLLAEYKKNVTILKSGGEAEKYNIERLAYATAQANVISAQAKALQIVKDRVCPSFARVLDNSTGAATCAGNSAMSTTQLVAYQNQVLLKVLNGSHFTFPMPAGLKPSSAINVEASRTIMKGKTDPTRRLKLKPRRLLLHDSGDDLEKDARRPLHRLTNDGDARKMDLQATRHRLLDMDTLGEQLGYDPVKSLALGFHEL